MHEFLHAYRPDWRTRRRRVVAAITVMTLTAWPWLSMFSAYASEMSEAPENAPRVIIEEVAWAGSSRSIADEWIELANAGNATATIGGWQIRGAGEGGKIIFLPPDAEIGPRGTYLVANYANTDAKSALAAPVALATTTVSLSNAALGIELRDASGMTRDRAGNGNAPFAGQSGSYATMLRVSATSTGDAADGWMTATSSRGYQEGVADFGAPGICDVCAVPAEEPDPMNEEIATDESDPNADESEAESTDESAPMCTEADAAEPAVCEAETAVDDGTESETENANDDERIDASTEEVVEESTDADDVQDEFSTSTDALEEGQISDDDADNELTPEDDQESTREEAESATETIPPITVSLSEIVSNPESGTEWIELALPIDATSTDRDLFLHDGQGLIARVASGTPVGAPGFLVVTLASAKLNNSGDEVSLREANGGLIERAAFGPLEKGTSWAKDANDADDVWRVTTILTPASANAFPALVSAPPPATPTPTAPITIPPAAPKSTATSTKQTAGSTKKPNAPAASKTTTPKKTAVPKAPSATSAKSGTAKTTAKKPAAKATTAKSASKTTIITPLEIEDMFDGSLKNIRVRVSGTVGTGPKLLGATHAFILLNEDGRGLIVYLPKHLHAPAYGSTVRMTGTLNPTPKGPELRMTTNDVWLSLATSTPPVPRTVDLLALGEEDGWSLTAIEGTVRTVNAASFAVESMDGTDVTVSVPAVSGFRVKRLAKGDRVRVIGLADPRKAVPTLLVRNGNEVTIVEHAKGTVTAPTASTNRPKSFPDWAPFGAAAGAIVATGAGKRLRELLRKRKLRLLAKTAP